MSVAEGLRYCNNVGGNGKGKDKWGPVWRGNPWACGTVSWKVKGGKWISLDPCLTQQVQLCWNLCGHCYRAALCCSLPVTWLTDSFTCLGKTVMYRSQIVKSDHRLHFTGSGKRDLVKHLGVDWKSCAPCCLQTAGMIEQVNELIKQSLKKKVHLGILM